MLINRLLIAVCSCAVELRKAATAAVIVVCEQFACEVKSEPE